MRSAASSRPHHPSRGAAAGADRLGVQPSHPRHLPAGRDRRRARLAERASLPIADLEDTATARLALAACARNLHLPKNGWGSIVLATSASRAGTAWTDDGTSRRPYDLRHAAVSLWLNCGVPATEVARRAGHGVAVLLKIYAHCIDGQADAANKRITVALGVQGTQPESDDEGNDDSVQAS